MRLGVDLDGVVADFNRGWMELHAAEFASTLEPSMVRGWDGLATLGGFAHMGAFWGWARTAGTDGSSIFRHLPTIPGALDTLQRLARHGHRIVVLTSKPGWAVHDTLHWLADNRVPTREVHMLEAKWEVACDVYLDDSPTVLPGLVRNRPGATVCRFVRAWNAPVTGAVDVASWDAFEQVVRDRR